MQIGKMTSAYPTRLGQMLVSAGLMTHQSLEEALNFAKVAKLPAGRVMIMSGVIDQQTLESVLLAQTMVRDKTLSIESAINLLAEAHRNNVPLNRLLSNNGWNANSPTATSELGELLVSATIVSRRDMQDVVREVASTGTSLTHCLLSRKLVTTFDLLNALAAYTMVKHENLSLNDATRVLRTCVAAGLQFDQALLKSENLRTEPSNVRMGDLLSMAGLLSDLDLLEAVETSLSKDAMLGELLVERGNISRYVLHCTLEIQQMLSARTINMHQAREILLTVNLGKGTLEQCIAEYEQFSKGVVDLLIEAQAVSTSDVRTATKMSPDQLLDVAEILYEQGFIERTQLDIARRCYRMVVEEFTPRAEAIEVLSAYSKVPESKKNFEVTQVNEILEVVEEPSVPQPDKVTSRAKPAESLKGFFKKTKN